MILARILAGGLLLGSVYGQDPVKWTLTSDTAQASPGSIVSLKLTAKIDDGWHFYSLTTPKPGPDGGPIGATLTLADSPAISSYKLYQPKPERRFDPNFKIDVETFQNEAAFLLLSEVKKDASGDVELTARVRYQSCNDHECLPPKKKTATFTLKVDPAAPAVAAAAIPTGYSEFKPDAPVAASATSAASVPAETKQSQGLGAFALTAFGLGLASIFTPCVFPMIPITVSFFLNQRGGLGQAILFSLGIIVFFCLLGVGVTAAVGPFGVNQLAANPWINGFIAVIFTAFALSLLGAFEITLPSGLLTKLDQASRQGGVIGTLLMGLTFSLTSFACIGPFMGSLLVASVQT